MKQTQVVQSYLQALASDLTDKSASDAALKPFVAALHTIDTSRQQRGPLPLLQHPTMARLDQALAKVAGSSRLLGEAAAAAQHLDWGQIYGGGGDMDPVLAEGMLAAQAAGTYGCFASDRIATGQFLLAPGVHYPLHTHSAPEIYYCLSGRIDIQHGVDAKPFSLSAGDYSITPPHRLHALTVGDEPTLLIYAWIGDLRAPIWIWSQNDSDRWVRQAWRREPGEPWKVEHTEPVTAGMMAEAHDEPVIA